MYQYFVSCTRFIFWNCTDSLIEFYEVDITVHVRVCVCVCLEYNRVQEISRQKSSHYLLLQNYEEILKLQQIVLNGTGLETKMLVKNERGWILSQPFASHNMKVKLWKVVSSRPPCMWCHKPKTAPSLRSTRIFHWLRVMRSVHMHVGFHCLT